MSEPKNLVEICIQYYIKLIYYNFDVGSYQKVLCKNFNEEIQRIKFRDILAAIYSIMLFSRMACT